MRVPPAQTIPRAAACHADPRTYHAEMNLRAVGVAVSLVALSTLAAATVDPPYDLRTEML